MISFFVLFNIDKISCKWRSRHYYKVSVSVRVTKEIVLLKIVEVGKVVPIMWYLFVETVLLYIDNISDWYYIMCIIVIDIENFAFI